MTVVDEVTMGKPRWREIFGRIWISFLEFWIDVSVEVGENVWAT